MCWSRWARPMSPSPPSRSSCIAIRRIVRWTCIRRQPLLPLLAVAHHRHGDQGMGGDPSQAPRQLRNRRRSAQPADLRHQEGAVGGCRALSRGSQETPQRSSDTATARRTTGSSATSTRGTPGSASALMLVIDVVLFGLIGLTIWAVQMLWIPFFAAGVINGIGHYWGYRNFSARRREQQHRAVGHPDRRRRTAQQPPRLCDLGEAFQ